MTGQMRPDLTEAATDAVSGAVTEATEGAATLLEGATEAASDAGNAVVDVAAESVDAVSDTATDVVEGTADAVSQTVEESREAVETATEAAPETTAEASPTAEVDPVGLGDLLTAEGLNTDAALQLVEGSEISGFAKTALKTLIEQAENNPEMANQVIDAIKAQIGG